LAVFAPVNKERFKLYHRAGIGRTSLKRQRRTFAGASGLCCKIVHGHLASVEHEPGCAACHAIVELVNTPPLGSQEAGRAIPLPRAVEGKNAGKRKTKLGQFGASVPFARPPTATIALVEGA
jgi:hypothetical protein